MEPLQIVGALALALTTVVLIAFVKGAFSLWQDELDEQENDKYDS